MFKHVDDRAMDNDIPAMVERPICRDGLREDESRALALIEDPIEFSQNVARDLWSMHDLQGLLIEDLPSAPRRNLYALKAMLREAIARRDWTATEKISDMLDDEVTASLTTAREYGIAFGAVLEQLRGGLLDLARLHNAGATSNDQRVANDIAALRKLLSLRDGVQKHPDGPAAD